MVNSAFKSLKNKVTELVSYVNKNTSTSHASLSVRLAVMCFTILHVRVGIVQPE